jgi:Phage integrase family
MRTRFKSALTRGELRPLRFHDLRHRHGTLMAAAGAPLRTLQGWVGHPGLQDDGGLRRLRPGPSQGAAWAERAFGAADPTDQPAIGGGYQSGTNPGVTPVNSEQLRSALKSQERLSATRSRELRNRRSEVRILSGALPDSADHAHLQRLRYRRAEAEFVARKLVSDSGRFSGDIFGDPSGYGGDIEVNRLVQTGSSGDDVRHRTGAHPARRR